MDDATFDRRTIAVAVLAIVGFVVLGVAIAVLGEPDDPATVLAGRTSDSTTVREDEPVISTTTTVPLIEIAFEPEQGLGFEQRRRWAYDPMTRTLRNRVILEPADGELLVGHAEVIPPSLLELGDFEFEPGTDDVTVADDGAKTFRFEVQGSVDEPGEVRWEVVTDDELDDADLAALAADLVEARKAGT